MLFILIIAGCQPNQKEQNQAPPENTISSYYKNFEGRIGKQKVYLHLIKYQGEPAAANPSHSGSLSTLYRGIFDKGNGPLTISGTKDTSGTLTLISYSHYNPVDTLAGTFADANTFEGNLHDTSGHTFAFTLEAGKSNGSFQLQVAALTDSLSFDSSKANGPKARVDYQVLWPGKDFTSAGKKMIADTIALAYYGISGAIDKPDVLLQSARDSFFAQYKSTIDSYAGRFTGKAGPSFNWVSMAYTDILWNADSLISLKYTRYDFTGGAHGLENVFCTVFDLKENKTLSPADVFKPGYEKPLQVVLEKKLREQYDIPEGTPLNAPPAGILFNKKLALTNNFYLTGNGMGFIYNPYEVAPYAVGQIELFVPFKEIAGLLKKNPL